MNLLISAVQPHPQPLPQRGGGLALAQNLHLKWEVAPLPVGGGVGGGVDAGSSQCALLPKTLLLLLLTFLTATQISAQSTCPAANPVTVTNTANTGTGSLRWAIDCINMFAPLSTVEFSIPGPGLKIIQPSTALPGISKANALIDGTTQSVIIDGASAGGGAHGLQLFNNNITVQSLYIRNFTSAAAGSGIHIQAGSGSTIQDNRLSGNRNGVATGTATTNFTISNNNIGLDGSGNAFGNSANGILIQGPPSGAVVSGNTIAYSSLNGVSLLATGTLLISDNSMYCNVSSGISRVGGPANPAITQANTQKITGTAASGRRIEVFEHNSNGCTGSIPCQGRNFLGAVITPGTGIWTLNLGPGAVPAGSQVTATSTQNGNNTSGFASCLTVVDCAALNVNVNTNPPNCFGGSNGSATAFPSGGSSPFTYLWSTGGNTQTITGLAAGNYTVTVTSGNGCTASQTAVVGQPPALNASISKVNVSCFGGANGSATASGNGGTPGYSFLWNTGANNATIFGLSAGTYTVTVTDANNCSSSQTTSITQPPVLSASISTMNASCFGAADGSATAGASGGTPSYAFAWNNGASGPTASNLSAGTYTVTLSDGNGCAVTQTATISQPPALALMVNKTDETSNGANDGTAQAVPGGGTPGYSYLWSHGPNTAFVNNLAPGTYTVTVTDSRGCTIRATTNINAFACAGFSAGLAIQQIDCTGNNNGAANASPIGGTPTYSYSWSTGAGTAGISGLPPGMYTVTVTDMQGCTATDDFVLSAPPALNLSAGATKISMPGASDGTATATASGGTPPLTFAWSSGATTNPATGLAAGIYTVTVTDSRGCTLSATATVGGAGPGGPCSALPAYALYAPSEVCGNAAFTLTVDDLFAHPDVQYLWLLPTGDTLRSSIQSIQLVASSAAWSGQYFVMRDSAGCLSIPVGGAMINVLSLPPGAAFAGNDTTVCAAGLVVLQATDLTQGTGKWVALGSARIDDPEKNLTVARDLTPGSNAFIWQVSLGNCPQAATDTVIYFLETAIKAGNDVYTIQRVQDIAVMEVLLNDDLAGIQDTVVTLLDSVVSGTLEYLPEFRRFRYTAEEGFRGTVQFRYQVCNPGSVCGFGCSIALVTIHILNLPSVQEGLVIRALGPNGRLTIRNLNGFSRVSIGITDRWGDLVFQEDAYDNGDPWLGDYKRSGRYLPRGAYYYFLNAFDGDKQVGGTMTGVIHLFENE